MLPIVSCVLRFVAVFVARVGIVVAVIGGRRLPVLHCRVVEGTYDEQNDVAAFERLEDVALPRNAVEWVEKRGRVNEGDG